MRYADPGNWRMYLVAPDGAVKSYTQTNNGVPVYNVVGKVTVPVTNVVAAAADFAPGGDVTVTFNGTPFTDKGAMQQGAGLAVFQAITTFVQMTWN